LISKKKKVFKILQKDICKIVWDRNRNAAKNMMHMAFGTWSGKEKPADNSLP
jgi:hypothetical protein